MTQDEYDLSVPIMVLPALTGPLPFFSFMLHVWSRALEQRLPTPSCYHAASVCAFFYSNLFFPLS
jgi:hypothetical protein